MPPFPFSPVGFSAEIDRVRPRPSRGRLPSPGWRPTKASPLVSPPMIPSATGPGFGEFTGPGLFSAASQGFQTSNATLRTMILVCLTEKPFISFAKINASQLTPLQRIAAIPWRLPEER